MVFTIGSELTDSGFPIFARNTYEKVEFFHVSRKNPYIQKCDELCNSQLDKEGFN